MARGLQGTAKSAATGVPAPGQNRLTLLDVPVGWSARIAGIDGPPVSRKQQLRAYGLLSGDWIRVIQHRPVTVAVVDHTELALEADLARCILIDACEPSADASTGNRPGLRGFRRRRRAGAQNQRLG
jgi:Fe2+ transport system protein FeoA